MRFEPEEIPTPRKVVSADEFVTRDVFIDGEGAPWMIQDSAQVKPIWRKVAGLKNDAEELVGYSYPASQLIWNDTLQRLVSVGAVMILEIPRGAVRLGVYTEEDLAVILGATLNKETA